MTKTYRKKPVEVQAWVFPETMSAQADLARELQQHGAVVGLYDYAVQKIAARFKDGANWRWAQAHISEGMDSHIARIGDMIILDPVQGWGVVSADVFAATHDEAQALAEETYEYAVQVKCTESKEWRLLSFKLPFITHKTTWFTSQSEAEQQRQEQVPEQVNSRIVLRSVSPPQVLAGTTYPTTESEK